METVVLDGTTYTKASVAAKDFRYTSDYIGQLCRAKKVDARLVGRSWFVNVNSLVNHKKTKYSKVKAQPAVAEKKLNVIDKSEEPTTTNKSSKKAVSSVIKSKTMKSLYDSSRDSLTKNEDGSRKVRVSYEFDESELLPKIKKEKTITPQFLPVEPAESKKVHISTNKSETSFTPDELPSVSLSGKLSVAGLEEASEPPKTTPKKATNDSQNSYKNKAISEESRKVNVAKKVTPKPKNRSIVKVRVSDRSKRKTSIEIIKEPLQTHDEKKKIKELFKKRQKKLGEKPAKSPESLKTPKNNAKINNISDKSSEKLISLTEKGSKGELKFSPDSIGEVQPVKISTAVLVSPLIATVLALICVSALFSASTDVFATASDYQSNVVLQVANLLELLQ